MTEQHDDKIRLGGMALRNGILVHSFDHWAVAVRTPAGEIKMASGRKPELPEVLVGTPVVRGVARMAEVAYLLPTIRRRLPEARLPFEAPGMGAALAASALISTVARRSKLPVAAAEAVAVGMSLVPALMAIRGSQVAGYHGAEHKAIGGYEQDSDAIDVTKEHERCGSHMDRPDAGRNRCRQHAGRTNAGEPAGAGAAAHRNSGGGRRRRDVLVDDAASRQPVGTHAQPARLRAPAGGSHQGADRG